MRIGLPVALACGVVLVAGCSFSTGDKAVDKSKVEQQISDLLTAKVGQHPKSISCPGDLTAKQGTTMRCQLEANDGSKIGLTVTVTSAKDNDVKFDVKVDNK
ncbi:MAG TPA: DUF4333 domain-containing protein [Streptosporangiaceae bacterium]|jgi:hypothetical protein